MVKHIASAKTILIFLLFWIPNIVDGQCLRSGTKTIPGNYATLTAAIADLQANGLAGPVILELQAGYTSASETFPITMGAINCASPINTITIRPAVGSGNLTINSNNNSSAIDIVGTNYLTIDGRQGGTGSTASLTISNTSGGANSSALRLLNGASNNIFQYVSFLGTCPSNTTGVIVFNFVVPLGNNDNLIDHCNINGNASAASPVFNTAMNGIYAIGNTGAPNISNTISNCNIFDCYRTGSATSNSGIFLSTGNSGWTITDNSFYFTTTKIGSTGTAGVFPINISNTGDNFKINNNFIGGSGPQCAGTMTLTGNTIFKGIFLSVGTTTTSSVQGNTIKSITINSSTSPPFEGINCGNGNYDIGNVSGNTIGSSFGTGNINLTTSLTTTQTAESKGIYVSPLVNGVTNISNNVIGSVVTTGSTTSVSHGFTGISNKSASTTISNNLIGSNSSYSINASTLSQSSVIQQVIGIIANCTTVTISNNVINHLSNSYAPFPPSISSPVVRGIVVTGAGIVSGNTIRDLNTSTGSTSSGINSSMSGIQQLTGASGTITIKGNNIYALYNTSLSSVNIVGLNYNSSTNTGIVSGNYIHDLVSPSSACTITGIYISTGTSTYQNNMIGLGYDTLGNSITNTATITGIWESTGTNKFYFNTVHVGGDGVANASWLTYAFLSNFASTTHDIRNNIFVSTRSNAGLGGRHYAVVISSSGYNSAGSTIDNNIYFSTGNGSVFGAFGIDVADLSAWRTAIGKDVFSKSVMPCFVNLISGFPDLHLTDCSGAGNPADMSGTFISSVTDDFDGEIRSILSPVDIGADAGKYNLTSSLGTYASASVSSGKNISVSPDTPPVNIDSMTIYYPAKFTGILTVDPVTGIINVTDAKPAGSYLINVKSNTNLSQSFTLTVTNPICSRANFSGNTSASTGNNPSSIAIGDFNLDGNQDFVTTNELTNNVTVALGDGLGGVTGTTNFNVGSLPKSVAVGDFNNDGKQDLAVANYSSNNVSILQGNGLGGFVAISTVSVGTSPIFVAVGDFTSDGIPDIAVANFGGTSVSIRIGNGNGTFSGTTEVTIAAQLNSLVVDDFNGDSKFDLAIGRSGGTVYIRLGNGLGSFSGTGNFAVGSPLTSIAVGDFNANGVQDIAAVVGNQVAVTNGNGTGGFSGTYTRNIGINGGSLAVGDFNGDGAQDLVSYNGNTNVTTLIGSAGGITTAATKVDTGSSPSANAVGDFNNDGLQDIATSYKTLNAIKIRLGTTVGIYLTGNNLVIADGSVTTSTLNNTDFGLVPVPYPIQKTFKIQNNGSASSTINSITITGLNASDFAITGISFPYVLAQGGNVDFNIVCNDSIHYGLLTATVHINYSECSLGDYDFAIQATGIVPVLNPYPNVSVAAGGNVTVIPTNPTYGITTLTATASIGFMGVISADPVSGKIYITDARPAGTYTITAYPSVTTTQTFVLTVTNPQCSYAGFTIIDYPNSLGESLVTIGDFNNDGNQDIASDKFYGSTVWLGNGLGGFNNSAQLSSSYDPIYSIVTADFNSDGKLDIARTGYSSSIIDMNFGNGLGGFGPTSTYNASFTTCLLTGDFNNDGKPDLACPGYSGGITVGLGNGNGGFVNVNSPANGFQVNSSIVGDFNTDGKLDIATASTGSTNVTVSFGNGGGGFSGSTIVSLSFSPSYITSGDFNSDGKQDFAVADLNSDKVSFKFGDGLGNFSGTLEYSLPSTFIRDMISGDFNGDGKHDLAVAGLHSTNIFINNGIGGFSNVATINTPDAFFCIETGDFNNDNIQDIISLSYLSTRILLGNTNLINIKGNGNPIADGSSTLSVTDNTDFGPTPINNSLSKQFNIVNRGAAPETISSITVTGVNAADFTITGVTFPITINGLDSTFFNITCTPATIGIKSAIIHVNNSGCLPTDYDFAIQASAVLPTLGNYSPTTITAGGNVSIVPSASPTGTPVLYATTTSTFKGILTADPITGIVKIVNAKPAGAYTITVKIGLVTKTFVLTVANPICSEAKFVSDTGQYNNGDNSLTIADFNADGNQDLIATATDPNKYLSINEADGLGGFYFYDLFGVRLVQGNSIAVGDINGDGKQDLLMADSTVNQISILIGDGLGGVLIPPGSTIFSDYPYISVGSKPASITLADFNGDGKLDLASANLGANTVSIRIGDGHGNFSGTTEVTVGTGPNCIITGDFNNDGKTDFATSNFTSNNVSIRLGNGTGGFTGSTNINVGVKPNSITVADFNNDGKTDFATANFIDQNTSNTISICYGNGTGGFGSATSFNLPALATPSSINSGDFNGDGNQDLVVANGSFNQTLSIFTGNGSGGFSSYLLSTANGTPGIVIGDINNDGFEDLVVGNTNAEFAVFLGKASDINIVSNGNNIPDGSNTFSISNNTDFGTVNVSGSYSRNYTIQNLGDIPFTVNSITRTGTNPTDFSISGIALPLTIASQSSANFTITFSPLTTGIRSAIIHVNNTDCNEGDYDFAVRGTYCVPPAFSVCPLNQNVNAAPGFCRQAVNYSTTVTGSPASTLSTTFTGATNGTVSGNGSGTVFNTGTTHVVITATNLCNVATCTFDITVNSVIDDNNVCTTDNCNSANGVISHVSVNTNDNNVCTTDGCNSITGIFHDLVNVYDNDSCSVDGCLSSSGIFHNPVNTSDNNICTIDGCISTSGIYHTLGDFDDGNICTDDACHSTTGISHTPVSVDDNDIYTYDGCNSNTGIYHYPIFTLKVFIEGYYSGNGLMDNYGAGGCLYVTHLSSNNTDVDTLQLTLVDATTLLPVASSKAILQTDGYAEFIFTSAISGDFYLKVNQRNSIETWSSVSISFSSHSYDFTLNANQAFGNSLVEVFDHLGYAFYSGDVCNSANQSGIQDGIVNNYDYLLVEQAVFNTFLGYVVEDLTGDGMVASDDYVLIQNNWYYNYVVIKP